MKKISALILSFVILFSLFVNVSVSANTYYSRVFDETGNVVFEREVDLLDAKKPIQACFKFVKEQQDDKIYTVKLDTATYYIGGSLDIHSNTIFDLNGSTICRGTENCPSLLRFGAGSERTVPCR